MWLRNLTHILSPQKRRQTQATKHINHKHLQKQLIPPKIINDTVEKADKSRSIPVNNLSNKCTQIEKLSEINTHRYNKNVSDFFRQGKSLASVTPDNIRIPSKNKKKKTPESLVIRKEPIITTVNSRKYQNRIL